MFFIATIKQDSTVDQFLKYYNYKEYTLFGNEFKLTDGIYVCHRIIELLPLLDLIDIEVINITAFNSDLSGNKDVG